MKAGGPANAKWSYESGCLLYRTMEELKAEYVAWRCVASFSFERIHEYLKAEGVEDAKWNYGAGCRPYMILGDLEAGGPEVPLVGPVGYLKA